MWFCQNLDNSVIGVILVA